MRYLDSVKHGEGREGADVGSDLESGSRTLRTAEPPAEFDEYELVLLRRPAAPPAAGDDEAELLQRQDIR